MGLGDFIKTNPRAFLTGVGAVAGGAGGAIRGLTMKSWHDQWRDVTHHYDAEQRKKNAWKMGLAGGIAGGLVGYTTPVHPVPASALPKAVPSAFKGVKSQKDVKKLVREFSLKHHPDRGGDAKKYREFIDAYNAFKKHPKFPKTAMVAFVDEMLHILNR